MSICMRVVGDCALFGSPFAVAGINLYIVRQQASGILVLFWQRSDPYTYLVTGNVDNEALYLMSV